MIETNFIYDAKTKQSTIEERELTPAEIQAKEEEASKLANERRIAELKNWFDTYFQPQLIQSMWQNEFNISPDPYFTDEQGEPLTYSSVAFLKNKAEEVRGEINVLKMTI